MLVFDLIKLALEPILGLLKHLLGILPCFHLSNIHFHLFRLLLVLGAWCSSSSKRTVLSRGCCVREATKLDNDAVFVDHDRTSGISLCLDVSNRISVSLSLDVRDSLSVKVGTALGVGLDVSVGVRVAVTLSNAMNVDLGVGLVVIFKGVLKPNHGEKLGERG